MFAGYLALQDVTTFCWREKKMFLLVDLLCIIKMVIIYCFLGAGKVLSDVLSELLQKIYRLTGENPDDSNM